MDRRPPAALLLLLSLLLVLWAAVPASADAATAVAAVDDTSADVDLAQRKHGENKPPRHPHHLYSHYGWLYHGYDYYSLATLAALKFKAALLVAAIFFGLAWWYGIYGGLKYGNGGYYGGHKCNDRNYDNAYDRQDVLYRPPPPPPLPPPPVHYATRTWTPAPSPAAATATPPRRYQAYSDRGAHAASEASARMSEDGDHPPALLQWMLRGLELMEVGAGALGKQAASASPAAAAARTFACRRRLACELERTATARPVLQAALAILGNPLSAYRQPQLRVTATTDCAAAIPGCAETTAETDSTFTLPH